MNKLFWKLPYEMRRTIFKWKHPQAYDRLKKLRTEIPEKINAPTFKPFIENKCIFVHIPKAAGISVGYSLFSRNTGNHTTVADYQMAFSKSEFYSFYKFSFVRNPWSRLLSAFLFMKNGGRNKGDAKWAERHLTSFESFDEFVLNWVSKENVEKGVHFMPQYRFITTPGSLKIKLDFVGRFENIEEDWLKVKEKIKATGNLSFDNKTKNKSKDYRSYYTDKTRAIVAEVYAKDIELFGYTF